MYSKQHESHATEQVPGPVGAMRVRATPLIVSPEVAIAQPVEQKR